MKFDHFSSYKQRFEDIRNKNRKRIKYFGGESPKNNRNTTLKLIIWIVIFVILFFVLRFFYRSQETNESEKILRHSEASIVFHFDLDATHSIFYNEENWR